MSGVLGKIYRESCFATSFFMIEARDVARNLLSNVINGNTNDEKYHHMLKGMKINHDDSTFILLDLRKDPILVLKDFFKYPKDINDMEYEYGQLLAMMNHQTDDDEPKLYTIDQLKYKITNDDVWKERFVEAMKSGVFQRVFLNGLILIFEVNFIVCPQENKWWYYKKIKHLRSRQEFKMDINRVFPFLLRTGSRELFYILKRITDEHLIHYNPVHIDPNPKNEIALALQQILGYNKSKIKDKEVQIALYLTTRYIQQNENIPQLDKVNSHKNYPSESNMETIDYGLNYFRDNDIGYKYFIEMMNDKECQLTYIAAMFCYYCSLSKPSVSAVEELFISLQRKLANADTNRGQPQANIINFPETKENEQEDTSILPLYSFDQSDEQSNDVSDSISFDGSIDWSYF